MALLCAGGSPSTEKRFIVASSGARVIVAVETDRYKLNDSVRNVHMHDMTVVGIIYMHVFLHAARQK